MYKLDDEISEYGKKIASDLNTKYIKKYFTLLIEKENIILEKELAWI
jgi:hypothetical protein